MTFWSKGKNSAECSRWLVSTVRVKPLDVVWNLAASPAGSGCGRVLANWLISCWSAAMMSGLAGALGRAGRLTESDALPGIQTSRHTSQLTLAASVADEPDGLNSGATCMGTGKRT